MQHTFTKHLTCPSNELGTETTKTKTPLCWGRGTGTQNERTINVEERTEKVNYNAVAVLSCTS